MPNVIERQLLEAVESGRRGRGGDRYVVCLAGHRHVEYLAVMQQNAGEHPAPHPG
jgi:hypothetical protein